MSCENPNCPAAVLCESLKLQSSSNPQNLLTAAIGNDFERSLVLVGHRLSVSAKVQLLNQPCGHKNSEGLICRRTLGDYLKP